MNCRTVRNDLLNEEYYEINHSSGLKIFVMEKPDYSGAFAMFGTKYGSVDTCFRIKGEESYVSFDSFRIFTEVEDGENPEVVEQMWKFIKESHQPAPNDVERYKMTINFPE